MKFSTITETEANARVQAGGLMWIMFHGDVFDPQSFEDWTREELTEGEIK